MQVALTFDERQALKALISERTRAAVPVSDGIALEERCLGAASEGSYGRKCMCPDCRAIATAARRTRRQRQAAVVTRPLVKRLRTVAGKFPIEGGDSDDANQVALLALYEAFANFNPDLDVPFEAFAVEVAKRRLWDASQRAKREKHRILTRAVPRTDGEVLEMELLPDRAPDPAEVAIHRWELAAILAALPTLTPAERNALRVVLNGEEYSSDRSVENAVQRCRRKLRLVIAA